MDPATQAELRELLDELERAEEVTAADLEEFRQSLPTDPLLAKLVQKALPYPWSEVFEFVEGSSHQSPYWRTAPDRTVTRSPADRRTRERFTEAARESRGLQGTVTHDGQEIPVSAAHVAEAVQEEENEERQSMTTGKRALTRLRRVLTHK